MGNRVMEVLGSLAGLVAIASVGVPVLIAQVRTGGELIAAPPVLWWACYLVYLVAFLVASEMLPRPRWLGERQVLAAQGVVGAAAYAMAPDFGWTAVLLVVTAVTAAFILPPRQTVLVVAAQGMLLVVVPIITGQDPLNAVLALFVYLSFQAFAVFVVWGQRREAAARVEIAQANVELRAATTLLAESSRSAERLRIARDLHDMVGHQLTALALELEVASHRATPPAAEHVARARSIARDLLSDVRAAVGELRAPSPGLRPALESLTGEVPQPRIHLSVADGLALDEERTVALIRCVQEVVTNTIRHADADNLWIDVVPTADGGTHLAARDDGCGAAAVSLGNGLTGIRERIEHLGGSVRFDAARGRGFAVVAQVPAP